MEDSSGAFEYDLIYDKHAESSDSLGNNTIDLANTSFINELWLIADTSEIIIKTSAFLPVVLWGIFGNVCLLHVILKFRHLRSPTNLLIGNMAAADLASLLIHPWVILVYDFFQNYQLGAFGCKVEGAIECALLLTSVMNLSAISYDRLTAIVLPKETRLNRKGAKILMAVTWLAGLILASPLFFYRSYKERQWLDFLEKYCTENMIVINIYWHVIITMMVWFPLLVMLICYIAIFIKLHSYEKMVNKQSKFTRVNYKAKVARTMFIVVVVFMICRLPFTGLIFYRNSLLKSESISTTNQVQNQVNGTYTILWFASKYLIFVNAAVNPVIYGMTNEKFRKAFRTTAIAKCLFGCKAKKVEPVVDKKKQTKETVLGSNKSKIFIIFKGKALRNNQENEGQPVNANLRK